VKKLVIALAILAALGYGVKAGVEYLERDREETLIRDRVVTMLSNMKAGGNHQYAICMWSRGMLAMSAQEFPGAADAFEAWAKRQGFETVTGFEIQDLVIEEKRGMASGGVARVTATVNGQKVVFRVPDRLPIDVLR
jgi:hypothetical protein